MNTTSYNKEINIYAWFHHRMSPVKSTFLRLKKDNSIQIDYIEGKKN